MATMDHRREIEYLRAKVSSLLAEDPPRRSRAKEVGLRLNRLIQLQLKRENKIARKLHDTKQHEASRRHTSSPRVSLPSKDGGSPDAQRSAI